MNGICPKCGKNVQSLLIQEVKGDVVPMGASYHCITLRCRHCNTVLGAQVDPVKVRDDILDALRRQPV